ncbi:MAG TPA: Rid family hydrolase [Acidimicrobiales bacterium]|jgi:enamine deaminase RidA (YjgF/YER057c/UK114 family)|nr:Rid family hydrolase [Acidimicrobiales bacterium]
MDRTNVNPWEWSKAFGFSQAVEVRGAERILICSGQTGIAEDGSPPSSSVMGDQVKKAFENLAAVLHESGFAASDVVKVNYYTTDVDELITVLGPLASTFFGENLPASTLLGVAQLAFPELKIEIEATAAR